MVKVIIFSENKDLSYNKLWVLPSNLFIFSCIVFIIRYAFQNDDQKGD